MPKKPATARPSPIELIEKYRPLVYRIAGGFQRKLPRNVLRDDLIAAGMSGLWDAIRRHPDGPSESFEWYVRVRVRGAILDELRAQDWLPRSARAAAEAASGTGAYVPTPAVVRFDDLSDWEQNRVFNRAAGSDALIVTKERFELLQALVETLPTREKYIVSQHYFEGVKFKDIGKKFGVTEPRISQIHARAITRLRDLAQQHFGGQADAGDIASPARPRSAPTPSSPQQVDRRSKRPRKR